MAEPLELKVIFSAVDKFVRPVNAITGSARAASKELRGAEQALKSLHDQQKLVDGFRSTNKALGIDTAKLEEARARVKQIGEAMAATTTTAFVTSSRLRIPCLLRGWFWAISLLPSDNRRLAPSGWGYGHLAADPVFVAGC